MSENLEKQVGENSEQEVYSLNNQGILYKVADWAMELRRKIQNSQPRFYNFLHGRPEF